jgi:anti-anti-sigma regulatory factor
MLVMINEKQLVPALHELAEKLDRTGSEIVLDFSAVRSIDSKAVLAIDELAQKADEKSIRVVLRNVNVDVYKVLKLVRLTPRLSFAA